MAFLGNSYTTQDYTPKIDTFSGDGGTVAFTLSRVVLTSSQVQVTVENVPQNPATAFSVLNNTITFTSAPPLGTNNIYVQYVSPVTQYNALQTTNNLTGGLTGSVPYQSTSGATAMLSPGSAGTFLQSNGAGAAPSWGSAGGTVGSISMYPVATPPAGYFLCDGSAISRSTYSSLFAIIGTTFGSGNGSTTFNLPDYRDRMPIGAGTTYINTSTGGSANAIVVSHTHTVTDPGHSHTLSSVNGRTGVSGGPTPGMFYDGGAFPTSTVTTGITLSTTGTSATNANLPPYFGIYFMIKT